MITVISVTSNPIRTETLYSFDKSILVQKENPLTLKNLNDNIDYFVSKEELSKYKGLNIDNIIEVQINGKQYLNLNDIANSLSIDKETEVIKKVNNNTSDQITIVKNVYSKIGIVSLNILHLINKLNILLIVTLTIGTIAGWRYR